MYKPLSSNTLRVLVIIYVMIAASFVLVVQAHVASAQTTRDNLIVGLQNDMKNMNYFDPSTNSVWKAYMIQYDFEALYTFDPGVALYASLADDTATTCPLTGYTPVAGTPGACVDSSGFNITVSIRSGITFTDGRPMNATDVVFSFQTLPWSTYASSITNAIWWPNPIAPLWNTTANTGVSCTPGSLTYACRSHVGVFRIDDTHVRFQLVPTPLPTGGSGAYALFFYDTLGVPIIPEHIWRYHLAPLPQVNYSSPSSADITDTWDTSISMSFGGPGQYQAAIGTGPFMITSWTSGAGAKVVTYPNYWGISWNGQNMAHTWAGTAYHFYPLYVRELDFIIYGSLDVISLALQKGEIDTLLWPLSPGFLSQVQYNPAISVEQVTDAGYYYLAFNMRKSPWNDPIMRTAISMAIDKNYIVNTLLGGFGIAGFTPIAIASPLYVNNSASYPAFDIAGGRALLLAHGYKIDPSTGFFTDPSGNPISTSLLTPPKDYDPVRADAGIMISNNLKAMGLDINPAPTSFDTIVAKAFSPPVNFDLYVLGWSLPSPFPETYLCTFFCHKFDVNINAAGSNSPGYNNPYFDTQLQIASNTINTNTRVKIIQDLQGNLTRDIPWNVLYYRKNLNAYRNDAWVGWVNYPPYLYNGYSIVNLRPPSAPTLSTPPLGALSVATSLPARTLSQKSYPIDVFVSQAQVPVANANVWVNATLTSGATALAMTGTTDGQGHFHSTFTTPLIQGTMLFTVDAASGGSKGQSLKQVEVVVGPPAPMAVLHLSTTKPVIHPAETTTVVATLVDSQNHAIPNQRVYVDTTLIQGTLDASSKLTDTSGVASFTYTAPATALKFPNAHLQDLLKANVSVPNTIVADSQHAALTIFVQNDATPAWYIASVVGTPRLTLDLVNTTTDIQVHVTNWAGADLSGVDVVPVLDTGETNVTVAATTAGSNKTGGTGIADFTVTMASGAVLNHNVNLRFTVKGQAAATSDEVELLLSDLVTPGYSAQIMYSALTMPYSATGATNTVSAKVYNQLGLPATDAAVFFQLDYGALGLPANFDWVYDYNTGTYGDVGLPLNSFGMGSIGGSLQNSTGQGPQWGVDNFENDLEVLGITGSIDSCDSSTFPYSPAGGSWLYYINATGITDALGETSASFTALPMPMDSAPQIRAYVGASTGANRLGVVMDACNFVGSVANAMFRIDSGVVIQRAPVFALGSVSLAQPVFTSLSLSAKLNAQFYTVDGAAASHVQIFFVKGQGSAQRNVKGTYGGTYSTNAVGNFNTTVTVTLASLSQAYYFGFLSADPAFAYGGREQLFVGLLGDFYSTPLFNALIASYPMQFQYDYYVVPSSTLFATATVNATLVPAGGLAQTTVKVVNGLGQNVSGAFVWSGAVQAVTDETGVAVFNFTAALGATEGLAVVTTAAGQSGRVWYSVMAANPLLTYGAISVTAGQAGSASTFTTTVTNTLAVPGTVPVYLYVGNNLTAVQQVTVAASGTATVTFSIVFANPGTYNIRIGTQTASATVTAAPPPVGQDLTVLYALAGGLLVVGIIAGVLVGMMLSRRRKPPTMAPEKEETAPTEKPTEEELGPDEQL